MSPDYKSPIAKKIAMNIVDDEIRQRCIRDRELKELRQKLYDLSCYKVLPDFINKVQLSYLREYVDSVIDETPIKMNQRALDMLDRVKTYKWNPDDYYRRE